MTYLSKIFVLVSVMCFTLFKSNATVYTAITSGNYNQPSVWQGSIAPLHTLSMDTIVIPWNVKIYADSNVTCIDTGNRLEVDGRFFLQKNDIDITLCKVYGMGSIEDVDSLSGISSINHGFTGTVTVDKLLGDTILTDANVDVLKTLYLWDGMYVSDGDLFFHSIDIYIGGSYGSVPKPQSLIITGTATLQAPFSKRVTYLYGSAYIGDEWNMGTTTVKIEDTCRLIFTKDLNGRGVKVLSGIIDLNGFKLTLNNNEDLRGARIAGSLASELAIETCISTYPIRFLSGREELKTLTINYNSSCYTVHIGSNLTITNELNMTKSHVILDSNYTIRILPGGKIIGGGSTSHIVTLYGSSLSLYIAPDSAVFFPVSTTSFYSPCIITSKNGTEYNYFSVNLSNSVYSNGTSGYQISASQPCVNATWLLQCSPTSTIDYDLELTWNLGPEGNSFDRTAAYVSNFNNGQWDKYPAKSASTSAQLMYTLNRDDIHTTGHFSVFDTNTVLNVQNITANNPFRIYPNPANDILHIETDKAAQATIHNLSGQIVNITQISIGNNTINISTLPQGMYYIQLHGEGVNGFGKFVKE